MKIMKIIEFQTKITKNQCNFRIPHENHENHENHGIQMYNNENHENIVILC